MTTSCKEISFFRGSRLSFQVFTILDIHLRNAENPILAFIFDRPIIKNKKYNRYTADLFIVEHQNNIKITCGLAFWGHR